MAANFIFEIMANKIIKDFKIRRVVANFEKKRKILKAISQDRNLPLKFRYNFFIELSKLPRNSASSRIKNRCVITGRGPSISRKYKISRIIFRELASYGIIPGITKSSW